MSNSFVATSTSNWSEDSIMERRVRIYQTTFYDGNTYVKDGLYLLDIDGFKSIQLYRHTSTSSSVCN
uniref:Uncharacterized protein n=1 Tax=Heterorhabditis bacteriophora TaxID=37862 RepID=A0A1I7WG28_HETBA